MALYLGNNKVSMSSFLVGAGGQGQDSKVEEYPQMNATATAYLAAAEAAYTDTNGDSVSVLDNYTGGSGIKDAPLGKALKTQAGTRYHQDETTGDGESSTISWEENP